MVESRTHRTRLVAAGAAVLAGLAVVGPVQVAGAAPPAAFTGTNPGVDSPPPLCLNSGDTANNCNIYTDKNWAWLNAGPAGTATGSGEGTFFFVVLEPGGGLNDGEDGVLSDTTPGPGPGQTGSGDTYTNRVFRVQGGSVTYGGTHDQTGTGGDVKVRLAPYDDTSNNGGEYRIAICQLSDDPAATAATWDYPVSSNQCKRDNFKIEAGEPDGGLDLLVTKDVSASYDVSYTWGVTKSAGTPTITGSQATVPYTVTVTPSLPSYSGWEVSGNVRITNPNDFDVTNVSVSDVLTSGNPCTLETTLVAVVPAEEAVDVGYTCLIAPIVGPPPFGDTNTVTIGWNPEQEGGTTPTGSASDVVPFTYALDQTTDECVTVTDAFDGGAAVALAASPTCTPPATPAVFAYSRTIGVPLGCKTYANTATATTTDTGTASSATASVRVCGPQARTIGFWQNKNGQAIIKASGPSSGVCSLTSALRGYAPFQDLGAAATCSQVATYVTGVIKAANASGSSMNAMLKAQMLATALDVYFTDPAHNALNSPAPLGTWVMDLTAYSAAFGGSTSLSVGAMLTFAASQFDAGDGSWYEDVKATQEEAKNAFDAINNMVAIPAP